MRISPLVNSLALFPWQLNKHYCVTTLLIYVIPQWVDYIWTEGFPDGSAGEESACNAGDRGDTGSIPGSGRSPGEENGNPLQYSCLKNKSHGQRSLAGYSPKGHKE